MTRRDEHWTERASASVLEVGLCSRGEPDETSQDRRWLWRLEHFLAVNGTNDTHRLMASDLKQYLDETCEHHWHDYEAEDVIEAHRQCMWCYEVEWTVTDV